MLIVELAIPFTRLVRAKNMVDSTAFSNLSGGQFTPESSGQFDPKWGGQFRPEQVVSLNRIGVVSFTEFSKEITQELGFAKVEKLEEGKLRNVAENQKDAQKIVNLAIKAALKQKCKTPEDLERQLKEKGIECKFTVEEGRLKYSSYSYQGVPIKGQDVGYTAKQLQIKLFDNQQIGPSHKYKIAL